MKAVRQAIVLAAGEGRRLRPVTLHTPKPLVPFFGAPLLDWAIDKVARAGATRIAVNAHHLADDIGTHLASLARRHPELELHLSREASLLGTGGAVRELRGWLAHEPFYVLNADAVFAAAADELARGIGPAQAALLVTREPTYRDERRLLADARGHLCRLDERSDPDGFTFCGLTLADAALPQRLPDGPSCILRQGFLPHLTSCTVALVETRGFFADTGTPEALIDAHVRGYAWVEPQRVPPLG